MSNDPARAVYKESDTMSAISVLFYRIIAWIMALLISAGLPLHIAEGRTSITAHTGCMGVEDNSIEAMEAGVRAGAGIIEFDLHFTGDGEPVLSHSEPEAEQAYVPLSDAFLFLSEHKNIKANVDVKSVEYLEKIVPLAERFGVAEQIFMTGLDENGIPAAEEKCPGIPYYLNTSADKNTDLNALAEKAVQLGATGININHRYVTPELIKVCHKNGLLVSVWTVDELKRMLELAAMGADNITTRHPDIASPVIG